MKHFFVFLSLALLLLSIPSDAADFDSPIQSPLMSPTSEPSSNSDCSSVIFSMVDCLSFLMLGSTDLNPTKTCCGGIKTVLEYNSQCFCYGLESSREMGFVLDDTKAFAMPKICNVTITPHCDVITTPAALTPISAPVESPTTSPSSIKSPAITPSSPAISPSSPAVTPSFPEVRDSSPATTTSSPVPTISSPATKKATSPSPSPSKSSTGILTVSKLFLVVVLVSSFSYILA